MIIYCVSESEIRRMNRLHTISACLRATCVSSERRAQSSITNDVVDQRNTTGRTTHVELLPYRRNRRSSQWRIQDLRREFVTEVLE